VVRILHTADIHLDSPLKSLAMRDESLGEAVEAATRAAFEQIIDTAIDEQATALLVAGDLFDGRQRSARTAVFLTRQFDRLQESNIRVFYIKGNHDAENPLSGAIDLPEVSALPNLMHPKACYLDFLHLYPGLSILPYCIPLLRARRVMMFMHPALLVSLQLQVLITGHLATYIKDKFIQKIPG